MLVAAAALVFAVFSLMFYNLTKIPMLSTSIIGGADGPTTIFLANPSSPGAGTVLLVFAGVALLVFALMLVGLPTPAGSINCAMVNESEQLCSVFIEDMSETEYNEYMNSLYEQGFQVLTSKSGEVKNQNYVAVGTVLSNGTVGLSVSYADSVFGIYISRGKE